MFFPDATSCTAFTRTPIHQQQVSRLRRVRPPKAISPGDSFFPLKVGDIKSEHGRIIHGAEWPCRTADPDGTMFHTAGENENACPHLPGTTIVQRTPSPSPGSLWAHKNTPTQTHTQSKSKHTPNIPFGFVEMPL